MRIVFCGTPHFAVASLPPSFRPLGFCPRPSDLHEQMRLSIAFHREIVETAGNRLLVSVWEGLGIELWTTLSLRLHHTEIYSKSAEHAELIEAFRRSDPQAPQLLHDHVMNYAPSR